MQMENLLVSESTLNGNEEQLAWVQVKPANIIPNFSNIGKIKNKKAKKTPKSRTVNNSKNTSSNFVSHVSTTPVTVDDEVFNITKKKHKTLNKSDSNDLDQFGVTNSLDNCEVFIQGANKLQEELI